MNTLELKEGQTYICTKSDKRWWTVGKEYKVFLYSDSEPAIKDDHGVDWHSSYLSYLDTSNIQFKLKEEQPKVTLDEPQKIKVPAFVAPFIDKLKTTNLRYGFELERTYESSEDNDLRNWIGFNENVLTVFKALENGYEVEEETKYYIQLQGTTWGTYLVKSDDKDLLVWQNTRVGTPFTEQEIKSIDERYWPFAVPIEKVAE